MSDVTRWHFNSFDLGCHFDSGNKFKAMQPTIITMVEASDYDALTARCAELEANLLHYGAHMVACDFIQDTLKCSCGFEAIRAAVADSASRAALNEVAQFDQDHLGSSDTPSGDAE